MKNIGKRLKFIAILLLTVILMLGTMLPVAAATAEEETTATVSDLISRLWNNRYMQKIKGAVRELVDAVKAYFYGAGADPDPSHVTVFGQKVDNISFILACLILLAALFIFGRWLVKYIKKRIDAVEEKVEPLETIELYDTLYEASAKVPESVFVDGVEPLPVTIDKTMMQSPSHDKFRTLTVTEEPRTSIELNQKTVPSIATVYEDATPAQITAEDLLPPPVVSTISVVETLGANANVATDAIRKEPFAESAPAFFMYGKEPAPVELSLADAESSSVLTILEKSTVYTDIAGNSFVLPAISASDRNSANNPVTYYREGEIPSAVELSLDDDVAHVGPFMTITEHAGDRPASHTHVHSLTAPAAELAAPTSPTFHRDGVEPARVAITEADIASPVVNTNTTTIVERSEAGGRESERVTVFASLGKDTDAPAAAVSPTFHRDGVEPARVAITEADIASPVVNTNTTTIVERSEAGGRESERVTVFASLGKDTDAPAAATSPTLHRDGVEPARVAITEADIASPVVNTNTTIVERIVDGGRECERIIIFASPAKDSVATPDNAPKHFAYRTVPSSTVITEEDLVSPSEIGPAVTSVVETRTEGQSRVERTTVFPYFGTDDAVKSVAPALSHVKYGIEPAIINITADDLVGDEISGISVAERSEVGGRTVERTTVFPHFEEKTAEPLESEPSHVEDGEIPAAVQLTVFDLLGEPDPAISVSEQSVEGGRTVERTTVFPHFEEKTAEPLASMPSHVEDGIEPLAITITADDFDEPAVTTANDDVTTLDKHSVSAKDYKITSLAEKPGEEPRTTTLSAFAAPALANTEYVELADGMEPVAISITTDELDAADAEIVGASASIAAAEYDDLLTVTVRERSEEPVKTTVLASVAESKEAPVTEYTEPDEVSITAGEIEAADAEITEAPASITATEYDDLLTVTVKERAAEPEAATVLTAIAGESAAETTVADSVEPVEMSITADELDAFDSYVPEEPVVDDTLNVNETAEVVEDNTAVLTAVADEAIAETTADSVEPAEVMMSAGDVEAADAEVVEAPVSITAAEYDDLLTVTVKERAAEPEAATVLTAIAGESAAETTVADSVEPVEMSITADELDAFDSYVPEEPVVDDTLNVNETAEVVEDNTAVLTAIADEATVEATADSVEPAEVMMSAGDVEAADAEVVEAPVSITAAEYDDLLTVTVKERTAEPEAATILTAIAGESAAVAAVADSVEPVEMSITADELDAFDSYVPEEPVVDDTLNVNETAEVVEDNTAVLTAIADEATVEATADSVEPAEVMMSAGDVEAADAEVVEAPVSITAAEYDDLLTVTVKERTAEPEAATVLTAIAGESAAVAATADNVEPVEMSITADELDAFDSYVPEEPVVDDTLNVNETAEVVEDNTAVLTAIADEATVEATADSVEPAEVMMSAGDVEAADAEVVEAPVSITAAEYDDLLTVTVKERTADPEAATVLAAIAGESAAVAATADSIEPVDVAITADELDEHDNYVPEEPVEESINVSEHVDVIDENATVLTAIADEATAEATADSVELVDVAITADELDEFDSYVPEEHVVDETLNVNETAEVVEDNTAVLTAIADEATVEATAGSVEPVEMAITANELDEFDSYVPEEPVEESINVSEHVDVIDENATVLTAIADEATAETTADSVELVEMAITADELDEFDSYVPEEPVEESINVSEHVDVVDENATVLTAIADEATAEATADSVELVDVAITADELDEHDNYVPEEVAEEALNVSETAAVLEDNTTVLTAIADEATAETTADSVELVDVAITADELDAHDSYVPEEPVEESINVSEHVDVIDENATVLTAIADEATAETTADSVEPVEMAITADELDAHDSYVPEEVAEEALNVSETEAVVDDNTTVLTAIADEATAEDTEDIIEPEAIVITAEDLGIEPEVVPVDAEMAGTADETLEIIENYDETIENTAALATVAGVTDALEESVESVADADSGDIYDDNPVILSLDEETDAEPEAESDVVEETVDAADAGVEPLTVITEPLADEPTTTYMGERNETVIRVVETDGEAAVETLAATDEAAEAEIPATVFITEDDSFDSVAEDDTAEDDEEPLVFEANAVDETEDSDVTVASSESGDVLDGHVDNAVYITPEDLLESDNLTAIDSDDTAPAAESEKDKPFEFVNVQENVREFVDGAVAVAAVGAVGEIIEEIVDEIGDVAEAIVDAVGDTVSDVKEAFADGEAEPVVADTSTAESAATDTTESAAAGAAGKQPLTFQYDKSGIFVKIFDRDASLTGATLNPVKQVPYTAHVATPDGQKLTIFKAFDISFAGKADYMAGEEFEVTLRIPYAAKRSNTLTAVYLDGVTAHKLPTTISPDRNYLTFTANHFSVYGIAKDIDEHVSTASNDSIKANKAPIVLEAPMISVPGAKEESVPVSALEDSLRYADILLTEAPTDGSEDNLDTVEDNRPLGDAEVVRIPREVKVLLVEEPEPEKKPEPMPEPAPAPALKSEPTPETEPVQKPESVQRPDPKPVSVPAPAPKPEPKTRYEAIDVPVGIIYSEPERENYGEFTVHVDKLDDVDIPRYEKESVAAPEISVPAAPPVRKLKEGEGAMIINGEIVYVRYRSSFMSRYIQSSYETKNYYGTIKNALLSYKGIKARTSWTLETYNKGRTPCAKINVKGKTLVIYLALNPGEYNEKKYHFKDMSDKPKYAATPMMLKVRSDRGLKYTLELIDEMMNKLGAVKTNAERVDYYLPYESTDELIDRSLIKVILPAGITIDENSSVEKVNISELIGGLKSNEKAKPEIEETVAEESVVEEPVVEEPVAEEPVVEEPVAEEPVAEEPVVEEAVVEEAVVEETVVEEPIITEPEAPIEIIHVDAVHADELLTDAEAAERVEIIETINRTKKTAKIFEINLDVICDSFDDGETVTLDALKKKKLINSSAKRYKVLARGVMSKTLVIIADKFSLQAVKMITLAGGHAKQEK